MGVDMNAPFIAADELGAARQHLLSPAKSCKKSEQNREDELFFTYDIQGGKKVYGWLTRNETTNRFTDVLLQVHRSNQHIQFIEWSDRINCMVEDGTYISSVNFFMTHEEFEKFLSRIVPCGE